jgi:exonuclease III
MKIITWNCRGAFRNKFDHLLDLNADLLVIQECEDPKQTKEQKYTDWATNQTNHLWIGDTKNKGLAVFAKKNIDLKKLNWSESHIDDRIKNKDPKVKHFLSCSVNGHFGLTAVWTHHNNSPNFGYMGQFWKYLQVNKSKLNNSIIAGDFNSNKRWDESDRWWNHSDVVNELKEIGIESLYHKFTNEEQGEESQPTFMHPSLKKPYHIDYCFASKVFSEKIKNVTVEPFEKWKLLSDHSPLIITFDE